MHALISKRIFVSAKTDSSTLAARTFRFLCQCTIQLILLLAIGVPAALGQASYQGKWNLESDEDPILQYDGAHNRLFKPTRLSRDQPLQSVLDNVAENNVKDLSSTDWQPASASFDPNVSQQKPFRTPDEVPLLIPNTPTALSFTSPESSIEAEEFTDSMDSADSDRDSSSELIGSPSSTSHANSVQLATYGKPLRSASTSTPSMPGNKTGQYGEPLRSASTSTSSGFGGSTLDAASVDRAGRLMDRYRVESNPNAAGLSFRPVGLVELLRQPIVVNQRSEMIAQYWETWSQWSELNSRMQFANWVNSIRVSAAPADTQFLTASKSQIQNQILEAKTSLSNSQARLQSFMLHASPPAGAYHLLPLPSDNPLIRHYVTNFQLYQNYLSIPAKFQNIDRELDDNLNLIVEQTKTVESAQSAAESQLNIYQNGRGNLHSVISAGQAWRLAETNLIQTVVQYNQKIADYSLNVIGGNHAPETVAAMLIGKSGNKRATEIPNLNRDSNFRSAMQPPQTQNGTLNQNQGVQSEPPRSVMDNSRFAAPVSPLSSSLSGGSNQPAADSRFRGGAAEPIENRQPSRQANPFRENLAAFQPASQPAPSAFDTRSTPSNLAQPANKPFDPMKSNEVPPTLDRASEKPTRSQFGDLPKSPNQNEFGGVESNQDSSSIDSGDIIEPLDRPSSGTTGDFRSSVGSQIPSGNQPNSGSTRPAQFNPLAPLPKTGLNNPQTTGNSAIRGATDPDSRVFDRFKSSGSNPINPPTQAGGRSMDGSPSGVENSSNPNNGMFSPQSFSPTRPADRDANRSPALNFDGSGDSAKSDAGPIRPPIDSRSSRPQDPNFD